MKKLFTMILFGLVSVSLFACQTTTATTTVNYDLFEQIARYQDVFNRREGTYLVYVYSDSCVVCETIKTQVYNFADTYPDGETGHEIYFFNAAKATDSAANQAAYLLAVGQTQVSTPVLLVIIDNAFDKTNLSTYYFAGAQAVSNILEDIKNGAYAPFQ
jgi:thiol-disulfide isomerase/thioredoxin